MPFITVNTVWEESVLFNGDRNCYDYIVDESEYRALVEESWLGMPEVLGKKRKDKKNKTVQDPLCPPQISYELAMN